MSDINIPMFPASDSSFLIGREIYDATLMLLEQAQDVIHCAYFIVACSQQDDPHHRVRDLLNALIRASKRGVDIKFLVDEFDSDVDDYAVNLLAANYLSQYGLEVKVYSDPYRSSLHSKYLLVDNRKILVGSGNWTNGALNENLEAALYCESAELCWQMNDRFLYNWGNALALEPVV